MRCVFIRYSYNLGIYLMMFPACQLLHVFPGGHKWAVSGGGSTVKVVRAAIPVGIGAASGGAGGLVGAALLGLGHAHQLLLLGNEGAVSSGGSAVKVVRAAIPVGIGAAAGRAGGLVGAALLGLSHTHQLLLLGNEGAVSGGGSAVKIVRAAIPVGIGAAASGAGGLVGAALLGLGHAHQLL